MHPFFYIRQTDVVSIDRGGPNIGHGMKKSLACVFAFVSLIVSGQDEGTVLKGLVTDSLTLEPLIGVNVTYAPGKGTVTDAFGKYSMPIPLGEHTITFSYVGYRTLTRFLKAAPANSWTLDARMSLSSSQLDMVVVSAGRFEQRVGEVTQSLSVLSPQLVNARNTVALNEVMDQVPGVVIMDSDPQIRAGSGFSYGAGSRVMMLVDDLPILSGDIGRPSWTFLPIENLEQVEVIKGASSVLYGSAALSGVINVRSAYPRAEPRTRVTTFGGMYDTPGDPDMKWWDQQAPVFTGASFFHSRQIGQLDLVLGGNAFSGDNYIGPERIRPDSLAADLLRTAPGGYDQRIRANFGLRWRDRKVKGLSYGVNANAMKSRSSSVLVWDDVERGFFRPEPGTVTRTLGTQFFVDPFVTYQGKHTRHTLRGRMYDQEFDNDNEQANASRFIFGEYQVQHRMNIFGETVLTGGLVWQDTQSEAVLYSGDPDGDGRNEATNLGGYAQVDKKLFDRLSVSAGVRYERFRVNTDQQERPVFRAGATCRVHKATYVRAGYGQGFRFPTIGERFISTSVGQLRIYPNPGLRPETSWNAEVGVKQGFRIGGFNGFIDVVAFQQEFKDFIEFTFGQWGNPLDANNLFGLGFMSVNTGGARVTGMEFEVAGKGRVGMTELTVLAGYTNTLPVSTTPNQVYATPTYPNSNFPPATFANTSYDTTGNILKFRVQRLFRADVQTDWRWLMLGVSVRYNSHVRNIDLAFVELDRPGLLQTGIGTWMETRRTGDWIVDARIGFDLEDRVRLVLLVNNLGNKIYAIRPLAAEPMRSFTLQLTYAL